MTEYQASVANKHVERVLRQWYLGSFLLRKILDFEYVKLILFEKCMLEFFFLKM